MAPVMRVEQGDGALSAFISAFLGTGPTSYSILSSVYKLVKEGSTIDVLLGVIIFLFSVVFPTVKLIVFYNVFSGGDTDRRLLNFVHKYGRFSMLDVYIVAVLILTIRSLPGGAQIKPSWGLISFTTSILISLYVSMRLDTD